MFAEHVSALRGCSAAVKIWVLRQLKKVVVNEEGVAGLNSEPFGTHFCPEPYRAVCFLCMDFKIIGNM